MDKAQARELVAWLESSKRGDSIREPTIYRTSGQTAFRLLTRAPEWLITFLVQRWGADAIRFTPRGMATPMERMEVLELCARALLDTRVPDFVTADVPEYEPNNPDHGDAYQEELAALAQQMVCKPPTPAVALPAIVKKAVRKKNLMVMHPLVDVAKIEKAKPKETCANKENFSELIRLLGELEKRPIRQLPRACIQNIRSLESLDVDFPNFSGVTEIVRRRIELQVATRSALKLPSLLLVGAPGIGKTEYARQLAKCLPMVFQGINASTTSASFVLTGGTRGWATGGPGVIAEKLTFLEDGRSLLVLLDELEKAMQSNYPILGSLLELLERGTAERFKDEYLNVEMNIEPMVSWICTANSVDSMDSALRSRLSQVEVPPPTEQQMPAVVKSIDRSVREREQGLDKVFERLSDETINVITQTEPRRMFDILLNAYTFSLRDKTSGSLRRGKRRVMPEHVRAAKALSRQPSRRSMGFL